MLGPANVERTGMLPQGSRCHFPLAEICRSLRPHWMVEKEGYIFVFGLDKEGSDKELDAYYEL